MGTITLEEHFANPAFLQGPGREFAGQAKTSDSPMAGVPEKLLDLGKTRIAEMEAAGIDMQVLSLNAPATKPVASSPPYPSVMPIGTASLI